MDYPRRELIDHVSGRGNICLNTVRQTKSPSWKHAIASNSPTPAVFVEIKDGSSVFPLYLYGSKAEENSQTHIDDLRVYTSKKKMRVPNINPTFIKAIELKLNLVFVSDGHGDLAATFGPEDIFDYIYAVFHSPTYRLRYAQFLKIDFPRVPLTSNRELLRKLCILGEELAPSTPASARARPPRPAGSSTPRANSRKYLFQNFIDFI